MNIKKTNLKYLLLIGYLLFLIASLLLKYRPGLEIGANLIEFSLYLVKILPCAFILIGLFEVWVKKETIEKHMGAGSGIKSYLWATALASMTVGGIYVALPVASSLHEKGADLEVIFTYIGIAGVARIPMTLFEALFLGIGFAIWRRLFIFPLIVESSIILGRYLKKKNYKLFKSN